MKMTNLMKSLVKEKDNGISIIDRNGQYHEKCFFDKDIWNRNSLFLLILGKSGNKEFNCLFANFFANLFDSLSSVENSNNNNLETHANHDSFLLLCNNYQALIEKFKAFIEEDQGVKFDLVTQLAFNVVSHNSYSHFNDELFLVKNSLREAMSKAIDLLYPIFMNECVLNNKGYQYKLICEAVTIALNFHYVSCDVLAKKQQLKLSGNDYSLSDIDENFLFHNFKYTNGIEILNNISKENIGALFFKEFNIHLSDESTFITQEIDMENQLFKNEIFYSPHYIYKLIRLSIQFLYIKGSFDNKELCCSVIHQIFDGFCGQSLVSSIIDEIQQYQNLLCDNNIEDLFNFNVSEYLKTSFPLDSITINHMFNQLEIIENAYWHTFGNTKNDFFITGVFKNLINDSYAQNYIFWLLEKMFLNNGFTILKKYYCYSSNQQIRPFSQYTKDELNDLKNNNPMFFVPDWLDINHPNVYFKAIVNRFCVINDLMKLNIPYSDLWNKLIEIQINFYQQEKPISFGINHSHLKRDKTIDSINHFVNLKKNNINIADYSDINFNYLHEIYDGNNYKSNYYDQFVWYKFIKDLIPVTSRSVSIYDFFKVINSIFYPYNGYLIKKDESDFNIYRMANFKELHQYLNDEIRKYNQDNNYYIKPIFLKIKSHGLGVSYFLNKFAEFKSFNIENLDISTMSTYADIIGLSSTWGNGKTGAVYNMYLKNKDKLSILYLDNFDSFKYHPNGVRDYLGSPLGTIKKIILKKSRLNYVDEFKVVDNEVIDISKIITICIGEKMPDICTKEIISSFKIFEIDVYHHNDEQKPNPVLENIWNEVIEENN